MAVIGTAGHVDHGKSALVQALTGRDPDRWDEEKRRGLTIDLGFAWAVLSDGREISFVDVPGHERFAKNMLAGIEAIDAALLVVAADEGWKAQTEEHLAVLDLLDVCRGVIALTKADRVDADAIHEMTSEVRQRLKGTSLASLPIVATSVVSGLGLDDLMHVIAAQTDHLPEGSGRTRMWIDRSFTMPGAGTIVTGTLLEGPLVVGDHVVLHPGGHIARVRGLQTHERSMDELGPRRRAAVNLAGLDYSKIHRGSMLGLPGHWLDSTRLLVDYRPARYATMPRKGSFHLHAGSGAWSVTLRLLSESLAMVDLPVPLPLAAGDRFILRESGRRVVVAGGRVLDPAPPRASVAVVAGSRLRQAVAVGPDAVAGELLEMRGDEQVATLASHSGGGIAVGAVSIGDRVMSSAAAASLEERLRTARSSHSGANPLRPGLPLTEAAAQLGVSVDTAVAIARRMTDLDVVGGNLLAREAAPSPELDPDWKAARQRLFWQGGLNVPPWRSLGLDRELVHALIRRGALIKVSDDLVCLPEHIDRVKQALGELPASFTVSQFRDRVGVTRKLAVPLLEWCDRQELTVRKGDARSVRPGALPGS